MTAICTEFQKDYPAVNLYLKKEDEKGYDYTMLLLYLGELGKGFKAKRVNKTTKKGTKVTYSLIKSKAEFADYKAFIQVEVDKFNEKWKSDLYLGKD